MGIASFSPSISPSRFGTPGLSILLAPVQALVAFFMPVQPDQAHRQIVARPVPSRLYKQQNVMPQLPAVVVARPISRLTVIREFDPAVGPSNVGRMAISGTMADVCAELERIASKESPA